jgi:outer membrane protein TolC
MPSHRAARTARGAADPSAPIAAVARFFHAPAASAPDEAALATWWRGFSDPELDRLVRATLEQGHATSAAALRLREQCGHEDGADATPAEDAHADDLPEPTEHREALALYAFYGVRLRQIATTATQYFLALTLRDRIACADAAIALSTDLLRGASAARDAAADRGEDPRPAMLADLHALRIRLRAQWDGALVALAYQTALPLSVLVARLADRRLPGACAAMPVLGGPDRLLLRRPDVLADIAREARLDAVRRAHPARDAVAARLASLAREQRQAWAVSEVEAALATLAGLQAELVPVRATVAAAEARFERARREAAPLALLDAGRVLHAFHDREIETRGRGYLALVDLYHAAGCGWPILSDPEFPA